eukprot:Anaeramoba_ignava/a223017_179.p1 GENE.a223017_179~~a223017_179.p1  ORF type:complete len:353 (+),score=163.09 a223017_179:32-1060(+)
MNKSQGELEKVRDSKLVLLNEIKEKLAKQEAEYLQFSESAEQTLSKKNQEFTTKVGEIEELKNQNKQISDELRKIETKLKEDQQKTEQINKDYSELLNSISEYDKDDDNLLITEKNQEITKLQEDLRKEQEELRKMITQKQTLRDELETHKFQSQKEIEKLTKELGKKKVELDSETRKKAKLEEDFMHLSQLFDLETKQELKKKQEEEQIIINQSINDYKQKIHELLEKVSSFEEKNKKLNQDIDAMVESTQKTEQIDPEDFQKTETDFDSTKKELEKIILQSKDLKEKHDTIKSEYENRVSKRNAQKRNKIILASIPVILISGSLAAKYFGLIDFNFKVKK